MFLAKTLPKERQQDNNGDTIDGIIIPRAGDGQRQKDGCCKN